MAPAHRKYLVAGTVLMGTLFVHSAADHQATSAVAVVEAAVAAGGLARLGSDLFRDGGGPGGGGSGGGKLVPLVIPVDEGRRPGRHL